MSVKLLAPLALLLGGMGGIVSNEALTDVRATCCAPEAACCNPPQECCLTGNKPTARSVDCCTTGEDCCASGEACCAVHASGN